MSTITLARLGDGNAVSADIADIADIER